MLLFLRFSFILYPQVVVKSQKIAEFEREHQATVFLVAGTYVEWLSHDWDVMVYVGSNEEAWVEERDEIRHGYTWVYALSPLQEDANCLGGHINTDQLMSLRAWQKKTAIDWLKKMKMPEYVIHDFETTGQVYVSVMGNYREFRTPNVVVKKKIAAFEKRRNNLVYLVIRDRALDINYFAYVTGERSGDGNLQEQKDCVRYDSLSVYEIFPGRGYVNQYYETSLSFNRVIAPVACHRTALSA